MKHDKTLIARVDEKTLKHLADIEKALSLHSRSEAIRRAAAIARTLLYSVKKGEKLVIVGKNGSKKELLLDGL